MRKVIVKIFINFALFFAGLFLGAYWIGHKYCLKLTNSEIIVNKHLHMIRLYDIWMMTKEKGNSIEEYLKRNEIQTIAIYGMSYMGIRLFHELKNTGIHIKYGLDCNPKMRLKGLDILDLKNIEKCDVDAVIVTAIFSFDEIKQNLEKAGFANVIALDEILYNFI